MIAQNMSLDSLNISSNTISNEGAISISNVLKTNPRLKKLYLYACGIEVDGLLALLDSMKTNTTMTTIFLGRNRAGYSIFHVLPELFKINRSLICLDLNCFIYPLDMSLIPLFTIARGLVENTILNCVHFDYPIAMRIAEILQSMPDARKGEHIPLYQRDRYDLMIHRIYTVGPICLSNDHAIDYV
jgi:hypothetical protein